MKNTPKFLRNLLWITILSIPIGNSPANPPSASTPNRHELIVKIRVGMTEQEVRELLGQPGEVRKIEEGQLLDGTRIYSSQDPENGETHRWAYGNVRPGSFASEGMVSFDKTGRVICAQSPVQRSRFYSTAPALGGKQEPMASPDGLTLRVEGIAPLGEASGQTVRWWSAKVTLANNGKSDYIRRTSIDPSIHRSSTVEIYDSELALVSRDDHRIYGSPISFDDSQELKVPAGQSKTEGLNFSIGEYFGALPPGRYFLRVCFPYAKDAFITSNLVELQVPDDG